tara:strand:+ start:113327 stop:114262 length:936 start_codon:yes stop_codon:yes gene_type:complete
MMINRYELYFLVCAAFAWMSPVNLLAQQSATPPGPGVRVIKLWPQSVPDWDAPTEQEVDTTEADAKLVGGKRLMRLKYVSSPELHIYPAGGANPSDTVVVICPGGGYQILAWDLEGTEIAEWLQSIGVTAAVCKYRVPNSKDNVDHWKPAVQDIQRSVCLIRSGAAGVKPKHVGVIGFSAGGNASARTALAPKRFYERVDSSDDGNHLPDFASLVYPAWLVQEEDPTKLNPDLVVTEDSPPMFFAHAANDRISCLNSVTMFTALHQAGVRSSLHVFAGGGHGFGARVSNTADDHWPTAMRAWMHDQGWIAD